MKATVQRARELRAERDEKTLARMRVVAHDLRNPISGILSASEYLLEDLPDLREEHVLLLQAIHSSSQFMLRLIDDVLETSTAESGGLQFQFEPADLESLVKQNLALNRLIAKRRRVHLNLTTFGRAPLMLLDRQKICRVIDKLVTNAIKFSNPDSRIEIRVGVQGDKAILSVQDHGVGIPAEEAQSALSQIVQGHGGQINLESTLGKGSTFTISLPVLTSIKLVK